MAQKNLSRWLRFIVIGVALCALIVYAAIIPSYGKSVVDQYPEFSGWYYPWLCFIWGSGLPVIAALFSAWRIFSNIGNDRSFTAENAKLLKWVSWLAAADSAYIFIGDTVLFFLGMNHPGIFLILLMVVFMGAAVTVAAACLSHLVLKASALQEQSDLTI